MINKVFIAAVSGETQYVGSLATVFEMERQKGDQLFIEHRTRGDVARESMLDEFLKAKEFDAMLCLDTDQKHPYDMLTRLRAHDLDMVCAHYYRRGGNPIQSLCYELTSDGTYPYLPMLNPPTEGLHEIAITGLGCVLIKRDVLEATQAIQPPGQSAFAIGPLPGESKEHSNWGSDFRFFTMARRLGFRLWLDASLESKHATVVWLGHDNARKLRNGQKWADAGHDLFLERLQLHGMNLEALRQRKRILEARLDGLFQEADPLKGKSEHLEKLQELSVAIYKMTGKVEENQAMIDWEEKYPAITRPDQLPTMENTPPQNHDEGLTTEQVAQERADMYRHNAIELVNQLPNRSGDE